MYPVIAIEQLTKTYASGHPALKRIDLEIRKGEIFALLGPNGAGKTTLISIICGIVNPGGGRVVVDGHDIVGTTAPPARRSAWCRRSCSTRGSKASGRRCVFRAGCLARRRTIRSSRNCCAICPVGQAQCPILELSGGMKRRVMIAKALSHEPSILFLDEPTAGVDVELRRDMWEMVRGLRERGVTIILTTHYIEEAEEMADRIGVISKGEIILVEDKHVLMHKLGKKQLTLHLQRPLTAIPDELAGYPLELTDAGNQLVFTFDAQHEDTGIAELLKRLAAHGIDFKDLQSSQSSLEEIFVNLVHGR